MSTRDWPEAWDAQHEALCKFWQLIVRQVDRETVEVFRGGRCIGKVKTNITFQDFRVATETMNMSYGLGVADGKAALARAILEPIQTAINQQRD